MKHIDVTFITSNPIKAEQLSIHLGYTVSHVAMDLPEIQSFDLHEIIAAKAHVAFEKVQKPVLVEDVSLVFIALGRLPGPFIKWFLEELDNEGLCDLVNKYGNRDAVAQVCYGLYDGKDLRIFDATKHGSIAQKPRGERGFGWNPIFIPQGYTKTWGEMNMEEQKETSMRRLALTKLRSYLEQTNLI